MKKSPPSFQTILIVACMTLMFSLAFLPFSSATWAQEAISAAHSVDPDTYVVGSEVTVTTQIIYEGAITAMGVEVDLPTNWTYTDKGGEDAPGVRVLPSGDVEFFWAMGIPASPVDFTYTVRVPEQATGTQEISATVKYRRLGGEETVALMPLEVAPLPDDAYELTATHDSSPYIADANLTVENQIVYTGFVSAMGVRIDLPEGWTYVSHGGDGDPGAREVAAGHLEIYWVETIPASPIHFTYTVSVPDWTSGTQEISAQVLYRRTGDEHERTLSPDPLYVPRVNSNGYIEGTVTPNVLTLVTTSSGGEAWTTSEGTYFMPHVAGTFDLMAKADGYEDFTQTVMVSDMETSRIDITLTAKPDDTTPKVEIVSPASEVTIYEGESVDFYANVEDGNPPFTYVWYNFPGGFTSPYVEDPGSITFHNAGTYNITFLLKDHDGDEGTDSVLVTVLEAVVDESPVASIMSPGDSAISIFEGEYVKFEGKVESGNAPFEYSWDFGGGAVNANVEDPGDVTFQDAGVYVVQFSVTDEDGDVSRDSVTVTVEKKEENTIPNATIASPRPPIQIYEGESLNFQGSVTSGNSPFVYSWDFDGAAPNTNVEDPGNVTLNTEGVYNIAFTVSEANTPEDMDTDTVTVTVLKPVMDLPPVASISSPVSGVTIQEGESVYFQGSVTDGNAPFTYLWDFDGAAANVNVEDPGHLTLHTAGTYTVSFTVTEADKPEDTDTASVTIIVESSPISSEPEATIISPIGDMVIDEGGSVKFEGSVTNGNVPFVYSWDFGGGAPNQDVEDPGYVTFDTQGVYKIIFTVTDTDNEVDSDALTITVGRPGPDTSPEASIISPSETTIYEGESLSFEGAVEHGNAPFTFSWKFSNGAENADVEDPGDVTFANQGVYPVTFSVTDIDGDEDSASVTITVRQRPEPSVPEAFIISPITDLTIQVGKTADFQASVMGGNAPLTYLWDFGGAADNMTVEDPGPVLLDREGEYTVAFTVTDADGETSTVSRVVNVVPRQVQGYMMTNDLRIAAVIQTEEKGPIEAIWREGGQESTAAGDYVIWGYFYANPMDVTWGNYQNPELFVKIWFDHEGRIDVNYFHVSVPDIEVYSDYPSDGNWEHIGTTTLDTRYIRQYYYYDGRQAGDMEENIEDGVAAEGYVATGDPSGYFLINDLSIGAVIRTRERGSIEGVWRLGGVSTTLRGDQVAWGFFHADPGTVTWGSEENPDLFVKAWFDKDGRVDVNFFHVSVPEIEVFSDFPTDDRRYDQDGVTIMEDRYIRHEYSTVE